MPAAAAASLSPVRAPPAPRSLARQVGWSAPRTTPAPAARPLASALRPALSTADSGKLRQRRGARKLRAAPPASPDQERLSPSYLLPRAAA